MNWSRVIIAGVVAGIATWIVDFVCHGVILNSTYERYSDVFFLGSSPLWFLLISVCVGIAAAILFAKSRACWGAGAKGGATYGFWLGLVAFFGPFYSPLVIAGFPYYLSWCQGSINLIDGVVGGVVLGLLYKKA